MLNATHQWAASTSTTKATAASSNVQHPRLEGFDNRLQWATLALAFQCSPTK